ncbi:AraC family transcriptional regulator [bacterium]|nr:AraC family transcriptional regulator [Chloroflexi bacterium CFX6]RIL10724.1 MAG: AraC family transcriptional regulator [bacterium]
MIDTPQIVQTDARLAAVIHLTIPRAEIQHVMGPAIGEVMATITAQGIPPAGPWFSHHLTMDDPATFDFHVGVPVATPVAPAGRVVPGSLPAARVARTVYHGSYEGLGDAWGQLTAWIEANGHTPAADLWEYYVTDPGANPDPATWQTELNRPLVG